MGLNGPKGAYKYVSDDGNTYRIRTSVALASAASLTASDGTEPMYPKGCKPRHAWLQGTNSGVKVRKKLVFNTASAPAIGSTKTLDGVTFTVFGYIGEKITNNF